MMKVLFLVHQFYPQFQAGTEKFIYNSAFMTQQNGNKVKVITYDLGNLEDCKLNFGNVIAREFLYKGIQVFAYQYKQPPLDLHFAFDDSLGVEFAYNLLGREKPDIVHVGHSMRVYPIILAAIKLGIPYIITITDFHLLCPKIIFTPTDDSLCSGPEGGVACKRFCGELPEKFISKRLTITSEILLNAKSVVAPSSFVADVFQREVNGLKVIVNGHGIQQSDISMQNRIYHKGDEVRFGFIGNLAIHKGVHILISAFSGLDQSKAKLSIFGSGDVSFQKQLKDLAGDQPIEFRGSFPPEKLSEILQEIDVLVAPSICYETYSFVIHEALASGIPVICSDLGGMPEQIVQGSNGFTFPAGNVQILRDHMRNLAENPELLNDMKDFIRLETRVPTIEQEAYKYQQILNRVVYD